MFKYFTETVEKENMAQISVASHKVEDKGMLWTAPQGLHKSRFIPESIKLQLQGLSPWALPEHSYLNFIMRILPSNYYTFLGHKL